MKKPKQASWRTLMRKASKAALPAEAKRLREQAAARRRVERANRTEIEVYPSFERATEVPRNDLEISQLARLEAELIYRDQQLVDEFISGVADLRRRSPTPTENPNFIQVPNSQIDAILKVLTRK